MSWWIKQVESFYREPENTYTSKRATIVCDTPQDLPAYNAKQSDANDPFILVYGSDADVISNGRKYILNGSNQWIIQPQSGGGGGGSSEAVDINYDNTQSGLSATNVQAAIDELEDEIDSIVPGGDVDAEDVGYNNIISGLTATNVQDAIDEVVDSVESVETTANTALQPSDVVSTYSATGTDPVNGTAVASALSNSGFITAGTTLAHYGIADAYISGGTITLGNNSITPGTSNFSGSFNDLTNKPTTIAGYGITDAFSGDFDDLTDKPTTLSGYGITDAYISGGTITLGNNSITPGTSDFSGDFDDLTNKPTTLAGYGITDASISNGTITLGSNTLTPGTSNFSGAFNDLTGKPTTLAGYGITDASISNGTITLGNNTLTPGTSNFSGAFTDLTGKPTTLSGYGITDANISSGVITLGSNTITPLTSSDVTSTYNALGTDPVNGIAVAAALAGGGGGGTTIEPFTVSRSSTSSTIKSGSASGICINGWICCITGTASLQRSSNTSSYNFSQVFQIDNSKYYPTQNVYLASRISGSGLTYSSYPAGTVTITSGGYISLNQGYVSTTSQFTHDFTLIYFIYDTQQSETIRVWDLEAQQLNSNPPSNITIINYYNYEQTQSLPGGEGHFAALDYTETEYVPRS